MNTPFKISVNQNSNFSISENDLNQMDILSEGKEKFHILKNGKPFRATITSAEFLSKKYTVTVNNNTYNVVISNALDTLIESMGIERGKTKLVNAIKAPMPGLILEINVEIGQEVNENDPLLILEAMKMENSFLSPRHGIIKSISVSKGDAVNKGQLLIEFE